jgi:DNA invertase Pin-like site-specific DNA recombinase
MNNQQANGQQFNQPTTSQMVSVQIPIEQLEQLLRMQIQMRSDNVATLSNNNTTAENVVDINTTAENVVDINTLLSNLQIRHNATNTQEESDTEYEVKSIIDHAVDDNGKWRYYVLWETGEKSWIDYSDCNCDELINAYNVKKGIKTAHIICRVSTKTQADENTVSLEAQEQALVSKAKEMGFQRILIYKHVGSAYKTLPVNLKNIKDKSIFFDIIMVFRVDRLSRNIELFVKWADELAEKKVDIYTLTENIHYLAKPYQFKQYVVNAQNESKLISDRLKMSINYRRMRGDHFGTLKFGKRKTIIQQINPETEEVINVSVIENNPEECEVINTINNLYNRSHRTTESSKFLSIANKLNSKNIKKRNRVWNASMVSYILKQNSVSRKKAPIRKRKLKQNKQVENRVGNQIVTRCTKKYLSTIKDKYKFISI